ncbi:unnamed protein product [Cylicocyclus nassatus]|uniref:Uncharacterized protein n=1 Tax=Cylicocyclus nassatus TaxID=53992 RepID=A0AA36HFW4_CYLNA|nr:unnamed protein product [Cylicocyclus nassatus]
MEQFENIRNDLPGQYGLPLRRYYKGERRFCFKRGSDRETPVQNPSSQQVMGEKLLASTYLETVLSPHGWHLKAYLAFKKHNWMTTGANDFCHFLYCDF